MNLRCVCGFVRLALVYRRRWKGKLNGGRLDAQKNPFEKRNQSQSITDEERMYPNKNTPAQNENKKFQVSTCRYQKNNLF